MVPRGLPLGLSLCLCDGGLFPAPYIQRVRPGTAAAVELDGAVEDLHASDVEWAGRASEREGLETPKETGFKAGALDTAAGAQEERTPDYGVTVD